MQGWGGGGGEGGGEGALLVLRLTAKCVVYIYVSSSCLSLVIALPSILLSQIKDRILVMSTCIETLLQVWHI